MIALACDHGGYNLKTAIIKYLQEKNIEFIDFGCNGLESVDYPLFAYKAASSVASGKCDLGIICCGTGIGVSMVANKVKGIRAAVVTNEFCAEMTRRHNNANVLCMGGRVVSEEQAVKFTEIFLNTEFEGDRHIHRLSLMEDVENGKEI